MIFYLSQLHVEGGGRGEGVGGSAPCGEAPQPRVLLEVDPFVDVLSESWDIPVKVQRAYSTHRVHYTLQGTTIFTFFDRMDPHRPEINATWNPCGSVEYSVELYNIQCMNVHCTTTYLLQTREL
jgi:hypothetical protein